MSIDQPLFVLRETVTCPHCSIREFLNETGRCVRCGKPLRVEYLKFDLEESSPGEVACALPARIGATLRLLRSKRGISQEKLARAAGGRIGRSTISRMECGHLVPSLPRLLSLARICGLTTVILRIEDRENITTKSRKRHCS
jgi:DNA-binding XRE family transcriptional regulator/DNA-directed RNA polymerase subunit RPC12/RpoP